MTWKQRCEDAERRVSIAEREAAKARDLVLQALGLGHVSMLFR